MAKNVGRLTTLTRLLRARHKMGFSSLSQRLAFYMQLNPASNWILARLFSSISNEKSLFSSLSRSFLKRGFGFGALRNITPEGRQQFSAVVLGLSSKNNTDPILDDIQKMGFHRLENYISPESVEQAKKHFSSRPYYSAQVFAQSDGVPVYKDWQIQESGPAGRYICFHSKDSLDLLNETDVVDMTRLKAIADSYCGFDTVLYGVNTMGTFPGAGVGYAMRMHRDYDDFRFMTFFISWTATTRENGATLYVPGSHSSSAVTTPLVSLDTNAGDVVAADMFGLHAGNPAVKEPRLTTWLRFGQQTNLATVQDGELR